MPAKKTFQDDQVIEKIMHLFWQQGYYHTSMDEIVITSGVKKQSYITLSGTSTHFTCVHSSAITNKL